MSNVLTLLIFDPLYYTEKDGASGPPQWIYFTCVPGYSILQFRSRRCRWAIGLFMYQTFDAVDGYEHSSSFASFQSHFPRKQARRTGMAGPLGEMFDHGSSSRFCVPWLFKKKTPRLRCDQHDGNLHDHPIVVHNDILVCSLKSSWPREL